MEGMLSFKSSNNIGIWLEKNHGKSNGVWLKIYKKGFNSNALRGTEVPDQLLCYGRITGQARKGTEEYVLWWICPRRKKSIWSEVNRVHAERLIREGRMKPSGMKEVEAAKDDGRWNLAYPPPSIATLPADFLKKVGKNRKARAFLKTPNRANTRAIIFRFSTATDKRRAETIGGIIKMLEKGKAFHYAEGSPIAPSLVAKPSWALRN